MEFLFALLLSFTLGFLLCAFLVIDALKRKGLWRAWNLPTPPTIRSTASGKGE